MAFGNERRDGRGGAPDSGSFTTMTEHEGRRTPRPIAEIIKINKRRKGTNTNEAGQQMIEGQQEARSRLGAIRGVASREGEFTVGIVRDTPGGPVRWFTTLIPPEDTKESDDASQGKKDKDEIVHLKSPLGATGKRITLEEFAGALKPFDNWENINVTPVDNPSTIDSEASKAISEIFGTGSGLPLERQVLSITDKPFALYMNFKSLTREQILQAMAEVDEVRRQRLLATDTDTGASVDADSLKAIYTSLKRDITNGRWQNPQIIVGGRSEDDVREVAGHIADAAACELPYDVRPSSKIHTSLKAAGEAHAKAIDPFHERYELRSPIGISTDMVARLDVATPDVEIGIPHESRADSAVTIPKEVPADRRIVLGDIYDKYGTKRGEADLDINNLVQHLFAGGFTGAGKTKVIELIVSEVVQRKQIPAIIVDPKGTPEGEPGYAQDLAKLLAPFGIKVREIDVAKTGIGMNFFDPEGGNMDTYLQDVVTVTTNTYGSAPGKDPEDAAEVTQRFMTDAVMGRQTEDLPGAYLVPGLIRTHGINPHNGERIDKEGGEPMLPLDLWQLIPAQNKAVEIQDYQGEGQNVGPFTKMRGESIARSKAGLFFGSPYVTTLRRLMDTSDGVYVNVLKTKGLSPQENALFMGAITAKVNAIARSDYEATDKTTKVRVLLVLEEVNVAYKEGSPYGENMADMAATGREFGTGIIYAGQTPSAVHKRVLGNTGNDLTGKLPHKDDVDAMASPTQLSPDQQADVQTLEQGEFFVMMSNREMRNGPVRIKVTDLTERLTSSDAKPVYDDLEILIGEKPQHGILDAAERRNMDEFLDRQAGGGAFTGLVDTIVRTDLLLGLGSVGIDDEHMQEEGIQNLFDLVRGKTPAQQEYLIRKAVPRAVTNYSQEFLSQASRGVTLEGAIRDATHQVRAALDHTEPLDLGHKYTPDKYKYLGVYSELIGYVAQVTPDNLKTDENRRLLFQMMLPAHPETQRLGESLGRPLAPEEEAEREAFRAEQIEAVREQVSAAIGQPVSTEDITEQMKSVREHVETVLKRKVPTEYGLVMPQIEAVRDMGSIRDLLFKDNPYNKGFYIDAPVGQSVKEAVDNENETSWLKGYQGFLTMLDFSNPFAERTLFNEVKFQVLDEADIRDKAKETLKPGGMPSGETVFEAQKDMYLGMAQAFGQISTGMRKALGEEMYDTDTVAKIVELVAKNPDKKDRILHELFQNSSGGASAEGGQAPEEGAAQAQDVAN